jgi:hypothetical protein
MELFQAIASDGGILLFSVAGLVATTVAILADTNAQRSELARASVRSDRAY